MSSTDDVTPPGLPSDPKLFKVLTEIDMIAHMATVEFENRLPKGMTQAQFGVLNRLVRLNTRETVSELATAFQVRQPTMSSTLKKLHAKNLIEFTPNPEDGRIKYVHITTDGQTMRNSIVNQLAPEMHTLAETIPDRDWDLLLTELGQLRKFFEDRAERVAP